MSTQVIANALAISAAMASVPRFGRADDRTISEKSRAVEARAMFRRAQRDLDRRGQIEAGCLYVNTICDQLGAERVYP